MGFVSIKYVSITGLYFVDCTRAFFGHGLNELRLRNTVFGKRQYIWDTISAAVRHWCILESIFRGLVSNLLVLKKKELCNVLHKPENRYDRSRPLSTSFTIRKVVLGIHDERWRSFRQMGLSNQKHWRVRKKCWFCVFFRPWKNMMVCCSDHDIWVKSVVILKNLGKWAFL